MSKFEFEVGRAKKPTVHCPFCDYGIEVPLSNEYGWRIFDNGNYEDTVAVVYDAGLAMDIVKFLNGRE